MTLTKSSLCTRHSTMVFVCLDTLAITTGLCECQNSGRSMSRYLGSPICKYYGDSFSSGSANSVVNCTSTICYRYYPHNQAGGILTLPMTWADSDCAAHQDFPALGVTCLLSHQFSFPQVNQDKVYFLAGMGGWW